MTDKPTGGLKGAGHTPRHAPGKGPAPSAARPPLTPPAGAVISEPVALKLGEGDDDDAPAPLSAPPATPAPEPAPEPEPVSRETSAPLEDVPLDDELEDELQALEADAEAHELSGGLLTAEELAEMRELARDKVAEDKRAEMRLKLMRQFEDEERVAQGMAPKRGPIPDERKFGITIGLPPFCSEIAFDNQLFFNGHYYEVTPAVYASLVDQMQHSWRHEDEINGHTTDPGRRERDTHIRFGKVSNAPMALNSRSSMQRH